MSRIGKKPVDLLTGVEVKVSADNVVTVKGPKGELSQEINKLIKVEVNDGVLTVTRANDNKPVRAVCRARVR